MNVSKSVFASAAKIISDANRELPADQALRQFMKAHKPKDPSWRREVSQMVFAWYKWFPWVEATAPTAKHLQACVDTNHRFQHAPARFDFQRLRRTCLPSWSLHHMKVSEKWLEWLQFDPIVWLRVRGDRIAELKNELSWKEAESIKAPLPCALAYEGPLDLFRTQAFHRGSFEIQDIGSQAVGLICAPQPGETWWDVCAGQGGKSLHLSDLMENKGLIWCTDRAAWRLRILQRRARRAQVYNYRTALWIDQSGLPTKNRFNGILVDAPCSGVGTWQRNPHARWTTRNRDVEELATVQLRLLKQCAQALKPGGRIVYSVCTLTNEETHKVADAFDEFGRRQGILPHRFTNPFHTDESAVSRLELSPQKRSGNGMFIAAWRNMN